MTKYNERLIYQIIREITQVQSKITASSEALWYQWFQITDPDADNPKRT